MKIVYLLLDNNENHENYKMPCENFENHKKHNIIQKKKKCNLSNYEKHRIRFENN